MIRTTRPKLAKSVIFKLDNMKSIIIVGDVMSGHKFYEVFERDDKTQTDTTITTFDTKQLAVDFVKSHYNNIIAEEEFENI